MQTFPLAIALTGLLAACHPAPGPSHAVDGGRADGGEADAGQAGGGEADAGPSRAALARLGPLHLAADAVPHAQMISAVIPELLAEGVEVQVTIFDDASRANFAVVRGELDANYLQTEPQLWRWRAAHEGNLAVAGRIDLEPMGIWSKTLTNLNALAPGTRVALPREPVDLGRALHLLRKAGLLELDERKGLDVGLADVTSNPHNLQFDLEAADQVARFYPKDELLVVGGREAMEAKLPVASALLREDEIAPFPNVVAVLEKNLHDPRVTALVAALRGPAERKFMADTYGGAVLAAY